MVRKQFENGLVIMMVGFSEIKIQIKNSEKIEIGDVVSTSQNDYEIIGIIESFPSGMAGKTYYNLKFKQL